MIAANDVSQKDIGFNSEENALTVFWQDGEKSLPKADKRQIAFNLLEAVAERYMSTMR